MQASRLSSRHHGASSFVLRSRSHAVASSMMVRPLSSLQGSTAATTTTTTSTTTTFAGVGLCRNRKGQAPFSSLASSSKPSIGSANTAPLPIHMQQQRNVPINRNNDGHRRFSSNSSIPVMMNDVNGHHQHRHCNQNSDNQDINTPTIAFEDPVQELLLLDAEEPKYCHNNFLPPTVQPLSTVNDPFVLTKSEMDDLTRCIRQDLIGVDHPVLHKAAAYFFDTPTNNSNGTMGMLTIRPMMVMMLISRALSDAAVSSVSGTTMSSRSSSVFGQVHDWQRPDLPAAQRRLAELCEMIHAGTLFHDDVTNDDDPEDNSETQQQQNSGIIRSSFGNKTAILAGDYFLARSSLSLARLHNTQVSEIMSTSIEHLARGQVMQIDRRTSSIGSTTMDDDNVNDCPNTQRLLYYLNMVFYKSASLMAQTCRSTALLGDYSDHLVDASYRYGKHMGMAAHLSNDIAACLDTRRQGLDMMIGSRPLSIDVLCSALESPQAWSPLMDRKFAQPGDVQEAMALLSSPSTSGVDRAKRLARAHAEEAVEAALEISSSSTENSHNSPVYRDALVHLAYQVASRTV